MLITSTRRGVASTENWCRWPESNRLLWCCADTTQDRLAAAYKGRAIFMEPPGVILRVGQVSVRIACRQRMLQIPGCEN